MNAKFKLVDYERMSATLEITMTISEWEELNEQLPDKWPSWKLGSIISSSISKLTRQISETIEEN